MELFVGHSWFVHGGRDKYRGSYRSIDINRFEGILTSI